MFSRRSKLSFFLVEGLHSFATSYFFYYLFFYMRERYGFGNLDNLLLSALNGFIYIGSAWFGGRAAQRLGYVPALRIGFAVMIAAVGIGACLSHAWGYYGVIALWTAGIGLTWPALEAVICDGESADAMPRMVGLYNMVWAGTGALAYFLGGALLQILGLASLFWLTIAIHVAQWLILWGVAPAQPARATGGESAPSARAPELLPPSGLEPKAFLRLAWIANPFAYMAINTVAAVMPDLSARLGLTLSWVGVFCSLWFFGRLTAFYILWQWVGWHYRLGWLLGAYGALVVSFVTLLLVPNLWVVMLSQIVFGLAIGLVYYSSLYYSMQVGETKGEHGGIHESAIGAGLFAGPALGAASVHLYPHASGGSTWAVGALLLVGGLILLTTQRRARRLRLLHQPAGPCAGSPTTRPAGTLI